MATRNDLTRRNNNVIRFDPWSELRDMRRSMDDLFTRVSGVTPSRFLGSLTPALGEWEPNVEMYETQEEVVFTADLPGFNQDDVDLQVTAETLQLTAQHNERNYLPQASATNGDANGQTSADSDPNNGNSSTAVQKAEPQQSRTYHIQGQQRRSFSLSYTLPVEINPDQVQATFQNGVLEVHMPKSERNRPQQVRVQLNA